MTRPGRDLIERMRSSLAVGLARLNVVGVAKTLGGPSPCNASGLGHVERRDRDAERIGCFCVSAVTLH